MAVTKEQVLEALKQVYDPEIPVDIVNLGLVYEVAIDAETIRVKMTTTSPGCPVGDFIAAEVERILRNMEGVEEVGVDFVRDPPWSPDLMSAEGRKVLGYS